MWFFLPSPSSVRRALWFALLLWCVVLKPVLVLACEVHETSHAALAGHAHEGAAHQAGQPEDEGEAAAGERLWQAPLHEGHFCVHGAIWIASHASVAALPAHVPPPIAVVGDWPCRDDEPMLRPPIER